MDQGVGVNSCFSRKDSLITILNNFVGILTLMTSFSVSADQFDTLNYSASAGISYDDNIFRLPSGVDPLQAIGHSTKSDLIETDSIGINLDKKYANQEFQLKANVTNNKFNTFSNLDYVNTFYNVSWNGKITSNFSGALSDSRTQTLNSFTDIHIYSRNLTTTDSPHLAADWWLINNWHLTFGATDSKTTSTQSVINNQSYTSQITEWGVKYTPTDGSSIAFVSRNIQNQNINSTLNYYLLVDTENSETQKELDLNWLLSGKSVLSGNLIYIDHQNPTFIQRDFSGTEGALNYIYSFSDKSNFKISFNRGIGNWYDLYSSYSIKDTFSIAPSWQISTKTNMHIEVNRSKTGYLGSIMPNTIARFDESHSEMLGLDWSPQRSVTMSTSFLNSLRYSNYSSYEYNDKSANLTMQVTF
jgi:exopolysaccharide biosynthesis operon protein EpsL